MPCVDHANGGGFTTVVNFDRSDQILICDNAFNNVKSYLDILRMIDIFPTHPKVLKALKYR